VYIYFPGHYIATTEDMAVEIMMFGWLAVTGSLYQFSLKPITWVNIGKGVQNNSIRIILPLINCL